MSKFERQFTETRVPRYRPVSDKSSAVVPANLDPRASGKDLPKEVGGTDGPEPTRFGDWEHNGRCTDF
ncbi:MAG: DUF1674 domain-containing protein [Rhodospirillaceae bacterium]|nr:DUF1674 domain-containing protein [Rhodospirillaceae bacterium]MBT6137492.1 DUF1674 domain-containing protein [Rhodospirillaceae bacterium]